MATVARGILHLGADLGEGATLPRHRGGREAPLRMTGHATGIEVRRLVTGRAAHRRDPEAVGATLDRRLMRVAGSLRRPVAIGMAVLTSRMPEHLAGLDEERGGSSGRILDTREGARCPELAAGLRAHC